MIDQKFEFIKEEIDIRIDSIKTELDNLGWELKKSLDEKKKTLKW